MTAAASPFGATVWCLDAVEPGRWARGAAAVAQSLYRRFTTPRGTLRGGREESTYGFDLAGYVGAVGTDLALVSLPGLLRAEGLKDERVADLRVTTAREDEAGATLLRVEIDVTLVDGSRFPLTLGVDAVSVALIGGLPA